MKRLILVTLSVVLIIGLCACGSSKTTTITRTPPTITSTVTVTVTRTPTSQTTKAPKVTIQISKLPCYYSDEGNVFDTVIIESISTQIDSYGYLKATMSGTNYTSSGIMFIDYKLYDSDGYVIESGAFITQSLGSKDKFKVETSICKIDPNEQYTLVIPYTIPVTD